MTEPMLRARGVIRSHYCLFSQQHQGSEHNGSEHNVMMTLLKAIRDIYCVKTHNTNAQLTLFLRQNTSYLVTLIFQNLLFLHWYWLSFSIARSTPFMGNMITMTLSHDQWIERYTYQSDDYITCVPWLHFAFYARVIEHVQCYVVPYTCLT